MNERKLKTPEKEIEKIQRESDAFEQQVKDLTLDRMNQAPLQETEPQTKLSQKELENKKRITLKPKRSISDPAKFNEAFRKDWEFDKEYVQFIAEHKELIGEVIEIWTRPYGGVGAEFWEVPTGRPVWAPRYLAEQIRRRKYHRLTMQETSTPGNMIGNDGTASYYGKIVVDTTIARLTAEPVTDKKSVFMGMTA